MGSREHGGERARRTRRALRAALLELVLERGLEATTVQDICVRAGLDRSTFYLHFADKRALLESCQRQLVDELFAGSGAQNTIADRVLAAFRHMARHAVAYQALLVVPDAELERRLNDYLAEHVAAALEATAHGAELPFRLLAQYVAGGLRGMARWWLAAGMPYPPEEIADTFGRILAHGLAGLGAGGHAGP